MIRATQTDRSLLHNAGEGWGGGEQPVRVPTFAPIRPPGTFPRMRGKGLLPKGGSR